jgi:hypothetical protein
MTVIAWDGVRLAADKMASAAGGIGRTCTKIWLHTYSNWGRQQQVLLALTGDVDVGLQLREWWKAGADAANFPTAARDDSATLIVISQQGRLIEQYATGPFPFVLEASRAAWGSGRDYAEAVMYLGHPAQEAVRVASVFQGDCGHGIDVLTFPESGR